MVQLDARASISIFQLIFYTPALIAATLLCLKHGFGRSAGWFFLLTVSLCRIAGGATQLATYSDASQGLFTASAILGSFGLSALLLAALGLLSRATDSSNDLTSISSNGAAFNPLLFRGVQLTTTIGLIISIVGDTNITLDTSTRTLTIPTTTKAGILVLLVAWILVTLIAVQTTSHLTSHSYNPPPHHRSNKLLTFAVLASLPLLLIRLIYAILTIFLPNNDNFNLIFPSAVTLWTLSTIEECAVVFIFLLVGFHIPKIDKNVTPPAPADNLPGGNNANNREAERKNGPAQGYASPNTNANHTNTTRSGGGMQRWRKGSLILALVGMISDLIASRKVRSSREQEPRGEMMTSMA